MKNTMKILSVMICALMLLSSFSMGAFAAELRLEDAYTVGDVDASRELNGKDSALLKTFVSGKNAGEISFEGADLNADGTLDAKDSYILKTLLSGAATPEELGEGGGVYKLLIAGNDISDYCIVVPAEATRDDNAHYAAELWQKYVEIATGVELEICYGEENRSAPHAVVYHMVELESELGEALGYDGYKYDITNGDVNIYGTLRGNMYCTYELLERVGFVYYCEDYTFLYERRRVEFYDGESVTYVPRLTYRMVTGTGGNDGYFYPQKLNGSQTYSNEDNTRFGPLTGPRFINAHSFGYYWRMATGTYTDDDHLYECWLSGEQKEESDYAQNPPWQPCATNNKDYEKLMLGLDRTITMIEKRGQKFTKNLAAMSFSIADNQKGYCACRNCTKKAKTEGYSGLYIDLTNRAARDIREIYPEYPTLKLMSIIYDHSIPQTVRPEENVIIFFCGQGCNNHPINSGLCEGNGPLVHKLHNSAVVESLSAWTEFCHEAGAEIWFWYYPVSFLFYVAPCPNVLKLYDDFDFIINQCGVDGFYFECGGREVGFEPLKRHLATEFIYKPHMTYEEFTDIIKEYLYIYYGDGYEYVYEYLLMQHEAGMKDECYLNNFSYPREMYNAEYVAENYPEMRELLLKALEAADEEMEKSNLRKLLVTCDYVGLSVLHEQWYLNGENAAEYESLYRDMCDIIVEEEIRINTFTDENGDPETLDPDDLATAPWDQE